MRKIFILGIACVVLAYNIKASGEKFLLKSKKFHEELVSFGVVKDDVESLLYFMGIYEENVMRREPNCLVFDPHASFESRTIGELNKACLAGQAVFRFFNQRTADNDRDVKRLRAENLRLQEGNNISFWQGVGIGAGSVLAVIGSFSLLHWVSSKS